MRGLDSRQDRQDGRLCGRRRKHRTERQSHHVRSKQSRRASRSSSRGRVSAGSSDSSRHRPSHQTRAGRQQFHMQVGRSSKQRGSRELQNEDRVRGARHSHETTDGRGGAGASRTPAHSKYETALYSSASETPFHSPESDLVRVRQCVYGSSSRPGRPWTRGRRGFCRWVPEESVQFSKVWRQPHRAQAQWAAGASRGLHAELDEWRVYKRLPDVPRSTWIRQGRQVREPYTDRVEQRVHDLRVQDHRRSSWSRH